MKIRRYDIGNPALCDVWVDPVRGDDANSGTTRSAALKSLRGAWNRIPENLAGESAGRRIRLVGGKYPPDDLEFSGKRGSYTRPIIIESAPDETAILPAIRFTFCEYIYFLNVRVVADRDIDRSNIFDFFQCRFVLIRNVTGKGVGRMEEFCRRETLKGWKCRHFYVEDSDFSGAWDNAIDLCAIHYGHVLGCRVHGSQHECMYMKAGGGDFLVACNQFYDGGGCGIMAGQTTGFQYMEPPWIHYECYNMRVVNNIIHNVKGAAMAVAGGCNILMAHNSCYDVGQVCGTVVIGLGANCSSTDKPELYRPNWDAGGWSDLSGGQLFNIPNKNVFVFNNIIVNPPRDKPGHGHFSISGAVNPPHESHIPTPARADDNLQIRGNIIWNGSRSEPLFDSELCYHLAAPVQYDPSLILEWNSINTLKPELAAPERGDLRPVQGSNVRNFAGALIPEFPEGGLPVALPKPEIDFDNKIVFDYDNSSRGTAPTPGAFELSQ